MSRSIQQVDQTIVVWELHHGSGNGNPTLFFHFHPVGFRMLRRTFAFHRTGFLNGVTIKQNLFGNGGFPRIGVRNNRKSAAFINLFLWVCHLCCLYDLMKKIKKPP